MYTKIQLLTFTQIQKTLSIEKRKDKASEHFAFVK
jgi:hypothetical protein